MNTLNKREDFLPKRKLERKGTYLSLRRKSSFIMKVRKKHQLEQLSDYSGYLPVLFKVGGEGGGLAVLNSQIDLKGRNANDSCWEGQIERSDKKGFEGVSYPQNHKLEKGGNGNDL